MVHREECLEVPVPCDNQCSWRGKRRKHAKHLIDCPRRLVRCSQCPGDAPPVRYDSLPAHRAARHVGVIPFSKKTLGVFALGLVGVSVWIGTKLQKVLSKAS